MEAISPSFDDFDLVVDAFQFAGMDRIIAVVKNPKAVLLRACRQTWSALDFWAVSQGTPLIDPFVRPRPGSVGPDMLELVS